MKTKSMNLALIMGAVLLPALTVSVNALPIPIETSTPSSSSSKARNNSDKNTANVGNVRNTTGRKASKSSKSSKQVSAIASNKASKKSNARGNKRGASVSTLSPVMAGFGTNPVSGPSLDTANLAALSGITPSVATVTDTTPIINVPGAITVAQGVPDGGATALLLGMSVFGFGWLKRKIAPIQ